MPSDRVSHKVAQLIQQPGSPRDRLTEGIFVPQDPKSAVGRIDAPHEAQLLYEAEAARYEAITVDAFTLEEYFFKTPTPPHKLTSEEA